MENQDTEEEGFVESTEEKAQRIYLSEIMRQLLTRDRFKRFFEVNYEVTTRVDEETGSFEVLLMEHPPGIAQQRLQKMVQDHAKEHEPSIVQASMADLKALELGKK